MSQKIRTSIESMKQNLLSFFKKESQSNSISQKPTELVNLKRNNFVVDKKQHRQLSEINSNLKELNGVKGVFIKEIDYHTNLFSWDTSQVLEIYEADQNGIKIENTNPILYAVAKRDSGCCQSTKFHVAITRKISDEGSEGPFILINELDGSCGSHPCELIINDNGNSNLIGTIMSDNADLILSNNYVKDLQVKSESHCCGSKTFDAFDSQGNIGFFEYQYQNGGCCSQSYLESRLGFPLLFNEDQNIILLSMIVYYLMIDIDYSDSYTDSSPSPTTYS